MFGQYFVSLLFRQRNATLYIQSARIYDEAVYVCEASNILGKSHSTALLRVAGNIYSYFIFVMYWISINLSRV